MDRVFLSLHAPWSQNSHQSDSGLQGVNDVVDTEELFLSRCFFHKTRMTHTHTHTSTVIQRWWLRVQGDGDEGWREKLLLGQYLLFGNVLIADIRHSYRLSIQSRGCEALVILFFFTFTDFHFCSIGQCQPLFQLPRWPLHHAIGFVHGGHAGLASKRWLVWKIRFGATGSCWLKVCILVWDIWTFVCCST